MTKLGTFIALYQGNTVSTARLLVASSDRHLVDYVAKHLLTDYQQDIQTSEYRSLLDVMMRNNVLEEGSDDE